MRLQPVPADEIDEPWWRYRHHEPRFRLTADSRLAALRQSVFGDAMAAVKPGRQVKVTTYVFAGHGVDPKAMHALLAQNARDRGWAVDREQFTDAPAGDGLVVRPQFHLACRRAGAGFVDGVLAIHRGALPAADEAYEAYLRSLQRRHAFLAFAQPSVGRTSWAAR